MPSVQVLPRGGRGGGASKGPEERRWQGIRRSGAVSPGKVARGRNGRLGADKAVSRALLVISQG